MSWKYKMVIMYDGTPFSGWQAQSNGVSIQQRLQEAIFVITQENVSVVGSGRTDAGVHALGQVAHFSVGRELDLYRFQHSLNALLPPEICVKEMVLVTENFHARYSAHKKTYRYHVCLCKHQSSFKRLYSWHFVESIDKDLLKEASLEFLGTHDFTSFANKGHTGCAGKNAVRTLYRLDITDTEDGLSLELEANGFLYKMVRNIVGTLLDVSKGKIAKKEVPHIFAAKDRGKAGSTAPPHGLFLVKVDY